MAVSQTQREAARRIAHEVPDIDANLPKWAQRKNPIILRQLGAHWRVFLPQLGPLIRVFLLQAFIVLMSIQFGWMYIIILTFLIPVLVALPFVVGLYVQTLGRTINYAATGMSEEYEHDTLRLLRTTPFSTQEIVLSKISAAAWRQAEDMEQLLAYLSIIAVPPLMAIYLALWPPEEIQGINQLLTLVTFASLLIRLPLEIFMVSALGTMLGATIRFRSTAYLATAVLVFFYYLLLFLARFVGMPWPTQMIVDAIVPLVLPVIIAYGAMRLTVIQIERD